MHPSIIQLVFIALCVIEAYHDAAIISIQDYRLKHYAQASKLWHKYSAWYVTLTAATICYLAGNWLLLPTFFATRLSFFNPILNVLCGKEFLYLSNKGIDGFFVSLFGKHAGAIVWYGAVASILAVNSYWLLWQ